MDSSVRDFIIGVGSVLVGVGVALAIMLFREMWNDSFDRMRDDIKDLSNRMERLERQQDRLEQRQNRMKGSIEGMREGRLTGIEPGERFRG